MSNISSFIIQGGRSYPFRLYLISSTLPYSVDWGDGTVEEYTADTTEVTHSYTSGTYTVQLIGDGITHFSVSVSSSRPYVQEVLTLGDSLTSLYQTFYNCSYLHTVHCVAPANVTNCTYTFYTCQKLKNVPYNFLPDGVVEANYMFGVSGSFDPPANFVIPNSLQKAAGMFGSTKLSTPFSLPSGIQDISGMFASCDNITSIPAGYTTPASVTHCNNLFGACMNLVTVGDNVTIGGTTRCDTVFKGCEALTTIGNNFKIREGTTTVYALFYECTALTTIGTGFTLPSTLTDCSSMFIECSSLTHLPDDFQIPATCQGTIARLFEGCSSLTALPASFQLPSRVGRYNSLFRGCSSLTQIPATLKLPVIQSTDGTNTVWMDSYVFTDCHSLTEVDIKVHDSSDSLPPIILVSYFLSSCNNIKTVYIPGSSYTNWGSSAFRDCPSLENIYCEGTIDPGVTHAYTKPGSLYGAPATCTVHFNYYKPAVRHVVTSSLNPLSKLKQAPKDTVFAFNSEWTTADKVPSRIYVDSKPYLLTLDSNAFSSLSEAKTHAISANGHMVAYNDTFSSNLEADCHRLTLMGSTVTGTFVYGGNTYGPGLGGVTLTLENTTVKNLLGGSSKPAYSIEGDITVNIKNSTVSTVYGAGYSKDVPGTVTVTISGGAALNNTFYAGKLIDTAGPSASDKYICNITGDITTNYKQVVVGTRLNNKTAQLTEGVTDSCNLAMLNLYNGTFGNIIFVGGYVIGEGNTTGATVLNVGAVKVLLAGGTVHDNEGQVSGAGVYGGPFITQKGEANVGPVTIEITGGEHTAVYGNGWAQQGSTLIQSGGVSVTMSGGSVGTLYAGGNIGSTTNASTVVTEGDVDITLTGGTIGTLHAAPKYSTVQITGNVAVNINGSVAVNQLVGYTVGNSLDGVQGTRSLNINHDTTTDVFGGFDNVTLAEGCSFIPGEYHLFYGQTVVCNLPLNNQVPWYLHKLSEFTAKGEWVLLQASGEVSWDSTWEWIIADLDSTLLSESTEAGIVYKYYNGEWIVRYEDGKIILEHTKETDTVETASTFALLSEDGEDCEEILDDF